MISTDPVQGRKYGYDPYEGLRPDGLYAFTGEGVRGDRKLLRGNLALISSAQAGRIVRRFTVRGVDATYIGAFTLADPPFDYRHVPDVDGPMRRGIILLLASVDANDKSLPIQDSPEKHKAVIADWIQPENGSLTVELQPRELDI